MIRRNGIYTAMTIPEKFFVDKGVLYFGNADKEELAKILFTIVYRDEQGFPHIKRCRVEQYINNHDYSLVPDGSSILLFSADEDCEFTVVYEPKNRMKIKEEAFSASDFEEKGLKAQGVRLASKPAQSAQFGVTRLAAKAARAAAAAAAAEELFPEGKDSAKAHTKANIKRALPAKKPRGKAEPKAKTRAVSTGTGLRARAEAARAEAAAAKAAGAKKPVARPKSPAKKAPKKR